jgi:GT2 family glycosyltransferase
MSTPDGSASGGLAFGVVVIGRNEGQRLLRCLQSVSGPSVPVVYVDSGSTDGSVAAAQAVGARVVELDPGEPFTAARARNIGFRALTAGHTRLDAVQFVDGDCEVVAGWLRQAIAFLAAHPEIAAVCGRRRERHPGRSVYNRLCDIEWDTPVGEARACGGDVMTRVAAFAEVGGFRADLIAGEEPELCVRLRAHGWRVWRLDAEMTLHDAAMTRFGQWWRRSMRSGYAFAEGALLHGAPPERHWVRESRSAWLWGVALPALVVVAAIAFGPRALWALAVYPLQVVRLFVKTPGPLRQRLARAFFLVLGKFAEAAGQIRFSAHRLAGARGRLIEYK